MVLCSSLTLSTFGRDKALLSGVLVGGVWNGFLLGKVRGQPVLTVMVSLFGRLYFSSSG